MPTVLLQSVFLFFAAGLVFSQSFDAASVKSMATGSRPSGPATGGPGSGDPGRVHYPNASLKQLISIAYDVKGFQIIGPDWLDTERFEVAAVIPPDTAKEQFQLMMQHLLAERFKLVIRRDSRVLDGYTLSVAKGGSRMNGSQPVVRADGTKIPELEGVRRQTLPSPIRFRLVGHLAAMKELAGALSDQLGQPVRDSTELGGKYDFTITYVPAGFNRAEPGAAAEPAPDLFTALSSQIGLKLDAAKVPVGMILIEHAERVPTEN